MAVFFFTLTVISLFCCGLFIVTEKGQLLGFLGDWYIEQNKAVQYIFKPVFGCVSCMASVWGTAIFMTLNEWSLDKWELWVITCVSAVFTNTFLYTLYDYLKNA